MVWFFGLKLERREVGRSGIEKFGEEVSNGFLGVGIECEDFCKVYWYFLVSIYYKRGFELLSR